MEKTKADSCTCLLPGEGAEAALQLGWCGRGARWLPRGMHPRGLLTQQEASREAAPERALPGAKTSPNQPEPPSEGLLGAMLHRLVSRCRRPASAAGTASPAEPAAHPSQKRTPRGNADGTVTGGFRHGAQLPRAPLPSQQLPGCDPVDQAVPGTAASPPAARSLT